MMMIIIIIIIIVISSSSSSSSSSGGSSILSIVSFIIIIFIISLLLWVQKLAAACPGRSVLKASRSTWFGQLYIEDDKRLGIHHRGVQSEGGAVDGGSII